MRTHRALATLLPLTLAAGCTAVLGIHDIPSQEDAGAVETTDAPADTTTPVGSGDARSETGTGESPDGGAGDDTGPGADGSPATDASEADVATDSGPAGDSSAPDASQPGDAGDAATTTEAGSSCAGTCVAAAPSGWTGPFQLYAGAPATVPSACPSSAPTQVLSAKGGIVTPAITCSLCTCTDGPVHCEVSFLASSSPSCTTTGANCSTQAVATSNSCNTFADSCNTSGWIGYQPSNPGDPMPAPVAFWTTTPSTQTPTKPAVTWSTQGLGCAESSPPATGCSGGALCVSTPATPFQSALCVLQTGNVACPTTVFVNKSLYYGGDTDSRVCSACGCTQSTGVTCGGTLQTYSDNGCATPAFSISNLSSGVCETGPTYLSWNMTGVSTFGTAASTPKGGVATGSVVATGPTTVCCTQ